MDVNSFKASDSMWSEKQTKPKTKLKKQPQMHQPTKPSPPNKPEQNNKPPIFIESSIWYFNLF